MWRTGFGGTVCLWVACLLAGCQPMGAEVLPLRECYFWLVGEDFQTVVSCAVAVDLTNPGTEPLAVSADEFKLRAGERSWSAGDQAYDDRVGRVVSVFGVFGVGIQKAGRRYTSELTPFYANQSFPPGRWTIAPDATERIWLRFDRILDTGQRVGPEGFRPEDARELCGLLAKRDYRLTRQGATVALREVSEVGDTTVSPAKLLPTVEVLAVPSTINALNYAAFATRYVGPRSAQQPWLILLSPSAQIDPLARLALGFGRGRHEGSFQYPAGCLGVAQSKPVFDHWDPLDAWAEASEVEVLGRTLRPDAEGRAVLDLWLKDPDPAARRVAVGRLSELGPDELVPAAVAACSDADAQVRSAALAVLKAWPNPKQRQEVRGQVLDAVRRATEDPDERVKSEAVEVGLAWGFATELAPAVKRLMDARHPSAQVVDAATELFGRAIVPRLLVLLTDSFTSSDAARALSKIGKPEDVPAIEAAYRQNRMHRDDLLKLIAHLAGASAHEFLASVVRSERDSPDRAAAIKALKACATAADVPLFVEAVQGTWCRDEAIRALASLDAPEARAALRKLAADPDVFTRRKAREVLGMDD